MIDIVNLFNQIANRFNDENKCGQCWEFHAPMWEDQINVVKSDNPCCVQMMMTNVRMNTSTQYNTLTNLVQNRYTDYLFNLYVLKQSNAGVQNFNEIKEYNTNTSKWETIYKPLAECLSDYNILPLCDILGEKLNVNSWSFTPVRNYAAMNYDGWLISISLRKYEND